MNGIRNRYGGDLHRVDASSLERSGGTIYVSL
jgi:hypothetical protein